MSAPPYLANFDSASAMLRALANCLHGSDFPMLGTVPLALAPVMYGVSTAVNHLPRGLREQVYIWSGRFEAILPAKLAGVRVERIARWATSLYPKRRYPAVMIGSSNGAAVHLCAALGIPWLPQTFLIPVARSGIAPDEPFQDMRRSQAWGRLLLDANPDIELHHMHDPVQDRLMIRRMTYFRVKKLRMGSAYEQFINETLEPGGTLLLIECNLKWPTTQCGDRHFFQFGALGGATPEEYHHGGPRVEEYLARHGSPRRRWEPPAPDAERPEAEWGFATPLREDVENFARRNGYKVKRVLFDEPEQLSPLAADLYRRWNQQRGVIGNRLLAESFIVMEPTWCIRTGSVPFWMVFNTLPSAASLENYLRNSAAFEEIYLMLFSHGVDSIGLCPIERWRALLALARRGDLIGVDENAYPRDFAVFVRYYFDLLNKIKSRYPAPAAVSLATLTEMMTQDSSRYAVHAE